MKTVLLKEVEFLTTSEAAKCLGIQASTLHQWRYLKKGPKFTRIGSRTIRYHYKDLMAWIDKNN